VKSEQVFFTDWNERTNRFLKHARGVVHIGAHEGQEAGLYAERGLPVLWVEALPDVFEKLERNIKPYYGQIALNKCLADSDDNFFTLNIASNAGQSSSIFALGEHKKIWPEVRYESAIPFMGIRFDSVVRNEHINLALYNAAVLDVQAAELLVLKGMGDTLAAFDWIRCECADFEIYKGGCQLKDLEEFLLPRDYIPARADLARHDPGIGSCYEVLFVKKTVWDALTDKEREEIYRRSELTREHEEAMLRPAQPIRMHRVKPHGEVLCTKCAVKLDPAYVYSGELRGVAGYYCADCAGVITRQAPALPAISIDGKKEYKVYAAMSSPRLGFQAVGDCIYAGLGRFNIPLGRNEGAFWHHGLQLSIEEGLRLGADFILTLDYDTVFEPTDIAKLVNFLLENPTIGAAVPLQQRREGGNLLATTGDEVNFSDYAVPIAMGHFGLTLFRREVFEKLSKPWFYEQPDPNGSWGSYRVDADMGFWHKCQEAEIWVYLCLDVVVGHLELVATYPDQDLKTKYCNLATLRSRGFAKPDGVFDRMQAGGVKMLNMCTPDELQFPEIKLQEATA
jgi:FkbM family methyltransferase